MPNSHLIGRPPSTRERTRNQKQDLESSSYAEATQTLQTRTARDVGQNSDLTHGIQSSLLRTSRNGGPDVEVVRHTYKDKIQAHKKRMQ